MSDQFESTVRSISRKITKDPAAAPMSPSQAIERLELDLTGWRALIGFTAPEANTLPVLRQLACHPELHASVETLWFRRHGSTLRGSLNAALSGEVRDRALSTLPNVQSDPVLQLSKVNYPARTPAESVEQKESVADIIRRMPRHVLR